MYKRILLLALSLLLMMGLTAQAEDVYEKINDAMYRIVLRTEQGDTTLGSGVLFQDQRTILTASSCCAQGDLYAIGSDGSEYRVLRYEVKNQADLALLTLEKSSPAEPLAMADLNGQPLPFLFGANAEDNIGSMPMYGVRQGMYGKHEALIFASEGDALLSCLRRLTQSTLATRIRFLFTPLSAASCAAFLRSLDAPTPSCP